MLVTEDNCFVSSVVDLYCLKIWQLVVMFLCRAYIKVLVDG